MRHSDQSVPAPLAPGEHASLGKVLHDQRKTGFVALGLIVADFWALGQLGSWTLGGCVAAGIFLGLANHIATEFWLLRTISSGRQPTRGEMMRATLGRLLVLSVVAVGTAAVFWPDGVGLLLGLAIFRLIALVMTTIPLLKELKKP